MRLRTRRALCLGVILAAFIAGGITFLAGRNRITQANFDRIEEGVSDQQVIGLLGPADQGQTFFLPTNSGIEVVTFCVWHSGPNFISVTFVNELVTGKKLDLATAWETLTWYAKRSSAKVGVNWD